MKIFNQLEADEIEKDIFSLEKRDRLKKKTVELIALFTFYQENNEISASAFSEKFSIRRQSFQEKLNIYKNEETGFINENKNQNTKIKEISIEKQISELSKKIESLSQNFSTAKISLKKNETILDESTPLNNYYLNLLEKNQATEIRSFATFSLVFGYFKFMVKMFGNRLLKEEFNNLLVEYGEKKIPNSFQIYISFMNQEKNVQPYIIKEAMLKNKEKKK
jgi:hypothetical protein